MSSQVHPIVCIGEILIDLISPPGESLDTATTFAIREGGAPMNAAVALARLGVPVRFVGAVGSDPFGDRLRQLVEGEGIDASHLQTVRGETTSIAYAWRDERGDGHFHLVRLADRLLSPNDIDNGAMNGAGALLLGSVALAASPAKEAVLHAVAIATSQRIPVVFDVNVRPTIWTSTADLLAACEPVFKAATVLKLSLDDAHHLWGTTDPAEVLAHLRGYSPNVLVLTDGSRGVFRVDLQTGSVDHFPVFAVEAVDPTGAGDAFTAALVSRLQKNGWSTPSNEDIRFAMAAGALATTRLGALPALPTQPELAEFLTRQL